jgi:hypothetical protein
MNELTADDIVTRVTACTRRIDAQAILASCSLGMLREVADLTYACDYPESRGRRFLTSAILISARD